MSIFGKYGRFSIERSPRKPLDSWKALNESAGKQHKCRIVYPKESKNGGFTDLSDIKNAVFLAGPCPRSNYRATDWREQIYDIFDALEFHGVILNPTNAWYDDTNADELKLQTQWEHEAMMKASAIIFWCDRSQTHPGFTTNVEIGSWIGKPGVFIAMPPSCTINANRYIRIQAELHGQTVYDSLEDVIQAVVADLNVGGRKFITSDTHFGQERTLTLSRRPFINVKEMDLEMISNWNKTVRMNDTVYHLGDFGDSAEYLKCLNFKEFNLVKGNYEYGDNPNNDTSYILKDMEKMEGVSIYDTDELVVTDGGYEYVLRHKPIYNEKRDGSKFYLFGHIHGRAQMKKNGFDVGVDTPYARYSPYSFELVNWIRNAIEKGYYDEQVYTEFAK